MSKASQLRAVGAEAKLREGRVSRALQGDDFARLQIENARLLAGAEGEQLAIRREGRPRAAIDLQRPFRLGRIRLPRRQATVGAEQDKAIVLEIGAPLHVAS